MRQKSIIIKFHSYKNDTEKRIVFYCFLLFDVNIFFVYFYETNFFWIYIFTIFSKLFNFSNLKKNVLFMEIYIPIESSILSLTKYSILR